MPQKKRIRPEIISAVLLVLLIVAMLFLTVFRQQNPANDSTNDLTLPPSSEYGTLTEVSDSKNIKFGQKTLSLNEEWSVSSAYFNSENASLKCSEIVQNDCKVYAISNGTTTFYISTPDYLKAETLPAVKNQTRDVNIGSENFSLTYEQFITERREGDSDESTEVEVQNYYQIYGCTNGSICVSSGQLSIDLETNTAQIALFEEFLAGLNLQ